MISQFHEKNECTVVFYKDKSGNFEVAFPVKRTLMGKRLNIIEGERTQRICNWPPRESNPCP